MKRMLCLVGVIGGFGCFGTPVWSADFGGLEGNLKQELKAALNELSQVREEIAKEKIPLSESIFEKENAVLDLRREWDRQQRLRDNEIVDLNVLKSEMKRQQDEVKFLNGLWDEYRNLFETRIHIAEVQRFAPLIAEAKSVPENPDRSDKEKLAARMSVMKGAFDRLEGLLGGDQFRGKVLSPSGVLEEGNIAILGPVALFGGESSAGWVDLPFGSPDPVVMAMDVSEQAEIKKLISSGAGSLPFDPTQGNASKLAAVEDSLLQHIMKGGPVMVPILVSGLIAVLIGAYKWFTLSKVQMARREELQLILNHLKSGQKEKSLGVAEKIKGDVGDLLRIAIDHFHEKKEFLEEVMYEQMIRVKPRLERLVPWIALTAATAPLLGLLGTVTGMINTFNMITVFGTGDPRTLSGGISEALITTEFGLIVAIPALLLHALVSRKVKGIMGGMEQTAVGFINASPNSESETED